MLIRMIETGGPIVYPQELNDPCGFKVDLNDKDKCFDWMRGMRIYLSGAMANHIKYKDISKGANLERAYADYQGKLMLYEINRR